MSKERLEEIKHFVDLIKYIPRDSRGMGEMDVVNVQEDMKWLIEQAELMQRFAKKNAELNVFLNKYSKPKHLGKNVIDVAMDIIEKQAERVQELEEDLTKYRNGFEFQLLINNSIKKQNKRFREALESIKELGEWGMFTDKYARIAQKALEGEE